jgi:hypothetical protein
MHNHRFWLSLLGGIAISLAVQSPDAFAQDAGRRDVVELGGLRSRAPADWVQEQLDDRQPYRQYRLVPVGDSADPAEVSIRFLGNGNGGTAADYVKRWEGMFLPPLGKTMQEAAKVRRLTLDGALATYVDIRGDYRGIPGDVATPRQNFRLLGVYFYCVSRLDLPQVLVVEPSFGERNPPKGDGRWNDVSVSDWTNC